MGFPVSELKAVEYDEDHPDAPPTVRTTFMGLYGVDSPLPTAWLDEIAQQREGHEAQEAFLDIFNHRILTQFYRIWRKYSYPATFEAGGRDSTSQSLLGLIGLGMPGTDKHIATPISRFLALLGIMRLPARTEEGIQALVRLLAPRTRTTVTPHCPRTFFINNPLGFYGNDDFLLDGYNVLGDETTEVSSQLLIALYTDDIAEAQGWLPEGQIYQDFLVLLRVYLGWRYKARIQLTVPARLLPAPVLGETPLCSA
jgi:type VI secretion system protein ImpH